MNLFSPKISVISLPSAHDRRDRIKNSIPNSLEFSFFDAVDGKDFSEYYQVGELKLYRGIDSKLSNGEFGCLASHLSLINDLISSNAEKMIILEDDVSIPMNFEWALTKVLEKIPKDYDIAYLAYNTDMHINVSIPGIHSVNIIHDNKYLSSNSYVEIDPAIMRLNRAWGLPAYIVSKAGAIKIMNFCKEPSELIQFEMHNGFGGTSALYFSTMEAIDLRFLSNLYRLNAYVALPMIVFPNMDISNSCIGSDRSYS